MCDWDEVKRLAADFQLTQTAVTLQRLSERNCVEIVKKLTQLNLLDVIYTADGKEYITPDHLTKEIEDELYVAAGRIAFNELASILNVDSSHIESKAKELARSSGGLISFIGDELINRDYKDQLALEINERLQKKGIIDIGDLTRIYSLPADILHQVITSHLGTSINGVQDTNNRLTFFTRNYLEQYKSRITGVLSAITRPFPLSQIVNKYGFPEKIFTTVVDDLLRSGRINGQVTSGSNKTFIPNIYLLTQKEWLENFYKHNGYLEYDALLRIGITEPRALKKRSGFEDLILLKTCCVGNSLFMQVEGGIEDCLASKSWTNLADILPSILDEDDIKMLIEEYRSRNDEKTNNFTVLNNTLFISNDFISECLESLVDAMHTKAEQELKDGLLFKLFSSSQKESHVVAEVKSVGVSKKEERKRKSGAKLFSTQGREVKTKAVKKKYRPSQRNDSDNSDQEEAIDETSIIETQSLVEQLHKKIDPDRENEQEVIEAIENHLSPLIKAKYLEIAREHYISSLSKENTSTKKTQADIQQTINSLYSNIVIFDKGLRLFDGKLSYKPLYLVSEYKLTTSLLSGELHVSLAKYLLRSLCSELVDNALLLILEDHKKPANMVLPLTIEVREILIRGCIYLAGKFYDYRVSRLVKRSLTNSTQITKIRSKL